MEMRQFNLAEMASSFTELDASFRYFHGRIYSFIVPNLEKFNEIANSGIPRRKAFPNAHPATIIVGRLAPLIANQISGVLTLENEQLRLYQRLSKAELPDCTYIAFISPAERSDKGASYAKAFESIAFLKTLMALAFGRLPHFGWVADFDFDENGTISVPGPIFRMPMFSDFFKIVDPALMSEVRERLSFQQKQYRDRLQRATKFFNLALNDDDDTLKFSSYWIALEIIVGGKSDSIRAKLSAAYGQRNKRFADERLLFKEIERMRHDLIHKGSFPSFFPYQERLMQLYFWDIVISQIGLRTRQLALALVDSGLVADERVRFSDQKMKLGLVIRGWIASAIWRFLGSV